MRTAALTLLCAGAVLLASPASAEVQLSMRDGHVTLSARNATVSQILAEWARVGQTKIVNGERVSGGPVTLELANVPEVQALDILLRSVGGYLLAPRAAAVATASRYDRILIVPSSSGARPPVARLAAPATPPPLPQPRFTPPPPPEENGDQDEQQQQQRFSVFPQPGGPRPGAAPAPAARPPSGVIRAPVAPVGVSVPGMVVPGPQPAAPPEEPADTQGP